MPGEAPHIGGMFRIEEGASQVSPEKSFLARLGGEDLRFCMSGRCALYYCLEDLKAEGRFAPSPGGDPPLAYIPAYTCETVIAPYKKAGYSLEFYDIAPEALSPRFDRALIPRLSVLALCGYYGFSSYDRDFVRECRKAGVAIVQDSTHSAFSDDGIEDEADYTAGSLRKWLGIPSGGIAVKRRGKFKAGLLPPEEEHIRGRLATYEESERALRGEAGASEEGASQLFWETEMRLRRIFDRHESDPQSRRIIENLPWEELVRKRRENYRFILEENPFGPALFPVFPDLPGGVCPSHLSLYGPDREKIRERLLAGGIKTTVYWPFHGEFERESFKKKFPGAAYIYDHIFSVPIDQRYSPEDMKRVAAALRSVSGR